MTISIVGWTPEVAERCREDHRRLCAGLAKRYATLSIQQIEAEKAHIDEISAALRRWDLKVERKQR